MEDYVIGQGFLPLAISVRHAERAGSLAIALGDPIDRMLIAQATGEGLLLVSNEALFDSFGAQRFWWSEHLAPHISSLFPDVSLPTWGGESDVNRRRLVIRSSR